MLIRNLMLAVREGARDGWEQPSELSTGMSYPDDRLQSAYDRAVNLAQVSRLFWEVAKVGGKKDHTAF